MKKLKYFFLIIPRKDDPDTIRIKKKTDYKPGTIEKGKAYRIEVHEIK